MENKTKNLTFTFEPVFAFPLYEPHESPVETREAHLPTRTRARPRTLCGDRWLDAVACEGSRFIWQARVLCLESLKVYSIGDRPREGLPRLGNTKIKTRKK